MLALTHNGLMPLPPPQCHLPTRLNGEDYCNDSTFSRVLFNAHHSIFNNWFHGHCHVIMITSRPANFCALHTMSFIILISSTVEPH